MKTIETDRLIIRQWEERDAPHMFKIYKNPNVAHAGAKVHKSIDESIKVIQSFIKHQESWAITLKEDNNPIGSIILADINRHDRYKELEYIISEDYKNKGYATEAVNGVLSHAFNDLNLMVVAVCHYPSNIKSKRVIEKCGFTYEGTLRKFGRNFQDTVWYSMTKEEWQGL